MRRSGFATRTEAQVALAKVLEYERTGIVTDDKQTVADYLTTWLRDKASTLKPTTTARYSDYVCKNLVPALGAVRLDALNHQHITLFIHDQLAAGRGPVTLRRCVATLSSGLTDRPTTTTGPQPRSLRAGAAAAEVRARLLVTDRGRTIPALLPRPR
ncbi:hypothetical protein ALI22I_09380 [Saccharothrix sp. ALI-22-I]|nr:hypothetical protein ALI22I_09380 [Saccharothrix sp. ALI-22-I]